ncbi:hypothetical protein ABEZ21_04005 [Brevibacillus porteri]|uniref:Helix-turn-helix domain-containing protein n=1 Tax=Brevibacillus porteri TaxID=2126350 RepID=A0ABX5FG28_9BACL|nr:hypothetical protein [Brevibacillus porteri]MED1802090.1 hypothetical protein [Brevibacillus porteri]MED2133144.1 hypothetical protein [Brevibacillus porteri]MED2745110.1 hypothetical protein [Brevibacillus porteri]MED2813361.1 hypothetical protein [Brevibacillus porteri]MED4899548.1 hypothetical protein [Brevibacillus porteri]
MSQEKNEKQPTEIEILQGLLESKGKYRKIIQAAIAKWVKDFQDGVIELKTADDLKTLIQLDIELQKGIRMDKRMQSRKKPRG